jgi:hypothetical protein
MPCRTGGDAPVTNQVKMPGGEVLVPSRTGGDAPVTNQVKMPGGEVLVPSRTGGDATCDKSGDDAWW